MTIEVIGFDADDTLWHSEDGFHRTIERYADLVVEFANGASRSEVIDHLGRAERGNLEHFGYGVKSFTLSMVEAAVGISAGRVPGSLLVDLIQLGKSLLAEPVALLDGVVDVVAQLAGSYRLLLITKGDLLHQERKIHQSGLAGHFEELEIVSEKDPQTYRRILHEHNVDPAGFVMVGNSVKSDILPVIAIGGRAVHIPYQFLWEAEEAEHDGSVPELASISDLPGWLDSL
jgi:putative hydrolase of the HAD superfamily